MADSHAPYLGNKRQNNKDDFADVVEKKGADPLAVKMLVDHILYLEHPEIRLRSNSENSM